MADMKYGTEKPNLILYDYVKLGAGIVSFDLLRTRHTNVIPLDQLIAQSSTSKGAAFILYNVARLQSILSTFEEHVSSGAYNKLPTIDQIDFSLLKEEVCVCVCALCIYRGHIQSIDIFHSLTGGMANALRVHRWFSKCAGTLFGQC